MSQRPSQGALRRHQRLSLVLDGPRPCDECGRSIEAGLRVAVYNAAPIIVHEAGCQAAWTPIVFDGGGRGVQLTLPLLAVVPDNETSL